MSSFRLGIVTGAAVVLLTPVLFAQGVAFQPVVGSLPTGPILNTTPSVSLDRRYVRMGINAQFIDNAAFSTFVVPGAVSGGPSGPGALGGVGLGGAGGGGGVGGGQFLAGMNGVIDPSVGYYPAGVPQGAAFTGYAFPYEMAPAGIGATPPGPSNQRMGPQRPATTKVLKRGRNLRGTRKQPARAAAAPTAPLPASKDAEGPQ